LPFQLQLQLTVITLQSTIDMIPASSAFSWTFFHQNGQHTVPTKGIVCYPVYYDSK